MRRITLSIYRSCNRTMRLYRQYEGFRLIFTHREKLNVIYSGLSYLPSPSTLSFRVNTP